MKNFSIMPKKLKNSLVFGILLYFLYASVSIVLREVWDVIFWGTELTVKIAFLHSFYMLINLITIFVESGIYVNKDKQTLDYTVVPCW